MKDKFTELKNRAETEIKKSLGGIVVFGEGNLQADVMLIGEAPGQEEKRCRNARLSDVPEKT